MRSRLLSLACSGVALMATDMARAGGLNSDPITEQPSAPEPAPAPEAAPAPATAQPTEAAPKASTKKASTKKAKPVVAADADPAAMVAGALKEGFCVVVWCQPGHEQYRPGDLVLVDDAKHKQIRTKGHARDAEKSEIEAALANGTGIHFS